MTLAAAYRNLPIRLKLRMVIMLTVAFALSLACLSFLVYDQIVFREYLRNDLGILAEMIGSNSTAALSFNDERAAEELLSGLRVKQHIISAFLYSAGGKPVAAYWRGPAGHGSSVPSLQTDRNWIEND